MWFGFCIFHVRMTYSFPIFLFLSFPIAAQEPIEVTFINDTNLKSQTLVAIDNFKTLYYINNNVLFKKDAAETINYSNLQLGPMTSANTSNPLKIDVFYKDFNTVIILDNRLAEIFKLDFNTLKPYRNISYISSGHDNTLWLFNQDTQQLEIYDYKNNVTRAKTLPVSSAVLDIKSNYNYCWLLTKDYLYLYNYVGTFINKIKNKGYTSMDESDENIILKKDNTLFFREKH